MADVHFMHLAINLAAQNAARLCDLFRCAPQTIVNIKSEDQIPFNLTTAAGSSFNSILVSQASTQAIQSRKQTHLSYTQVEKAPKNFRS
jgi:hypothetical protein